MKKVTIITPYFNSSKYFLHTYDSIIGQSHTDWEWIICDDASSAEELSFLRSVTKGNANIKIISHKENKGAGPARNTALEYVTGNYLTFIDADDIWDQDFLSCMIGELDALGVDMIYAGYRRRYQDGSTDVFVPRKHHTANNVLRGCDISCLSTLIKLRHSHDIPKFGQLKARNDLVFFHFLLKTCTCYRSSIVKAEYRIHTTSLSYNKWKLLSYQWHVSRNIAGRSIPSSCLDVSFWMLYGLVKYRKKILSL